MKRILLTRSEEENNKLAKSLEGFEIISSPMIYYKDLPIIWEEFKGYSNLIITSKYAAKLVSENYPYRVLAYVVGEESANMLKKNPNVTLGGVFENVELLSSLLRGAHKVIDMTCQEKMGELQAQKSLDCVTMLAMTSNVLYLSGNHITQQIPNVTRKEIYHTEYATSLNPQISEGSIDYVLIYSKNSANNLIKLLRRHNLLQNIQNSVSISLSKKLAEQLRNYVSDIIYPEKPIADDMIKLLFEYERNARPL